MSIKYPLAGLSLGEVTPHLSIEGVYRVKQDTDKELVGEKVRHTSDLKETGPYEYYLINNEKYRLLSHTGDGMKGRPFFVPFHEYRHDQYRSDAHKFIFRTHKKFEKALKMISTKDFHYQDVFNQLVGGKAKSAGQLLDLLNDMNLEAPSQEDGNNYWVTFMYEFLKVEKLSLEMVEIFHEKIEGLVDPSDSEQAALNHPQARNKCVNIDLPQELGEKHRMSSMQLMTLPAKLPIPKLHGITKRDMQVVLKEIASEAFKAAVPKSREKIFMYNRASKISGVLECIQSLQEDAVGTFPQIKPEIDNFFFAARRMATMRRRATDLREDTKSEYFQSKAEFDKAFKELPDEHQKSSLAKIVNPDNALGASLQLKFPLAESISQLHDRMQGFCLLPNSSQHTR